MLYWFYAKANLGWLIKESLRAVEAFLLLFRANLVKRASLFIKINKDYYNKRLYGHSSTIILYQKKRDFN